MTNLPNDQNSFRPISQQDLDRYYIQQAEDIANKKAGSAFWAVMTFAVILGGGSLCFHLQTVFDPMWVWGLELGAIVLCGLMLKISKL